MRLGAPRTTSFILRPTVALAIVYFGLASIWFLWILVTAESPPAGSTEPFRLITTTEYAVVSALDAALLAAFAVDAYLARGGPPVLRRAHFAGLVLGAITLGLVQLAAHYAHGPIG